MSRKREAIFVGIGVLAGLVLSGPAAQAADYLTARPSTQTFYINGQQAPLTAYLIGGSNYIRLRDIGKAVDFGVTYDAATNSVYIDPDAHYEQEMTTPAQTTAFPAANITEESVQAVLEQLKQIYPTGTVFPAPYRSTSGGPYSRGIHCSGWATLCSDAAFGDLPWRRIDRPSWEQLRPGDIVEYKNEKSYHAVVIVRKTAEYIVVTESGMNNHAVWGGQYFRWWLEEQPHYICYTRYPHRHPQTQPGGAPRSAARPVLPVSPPVKRFVPVLRAGWHPYTSQQLNAVLTPWYGAVAGCGLHRCEKNMWLF